MMTLGPFVLLLATFSVAQSETSVWIFGGGAPLNARRKDVHSLKLGVEGAQWVSRPDLQYRKTRPVVLKRADGYIYILDEKSAEKIDPNNATDWIPAHKTIIRGSRDGPNVFGEINDVVYVYNAAWKGSHKLEKWDFTQHKFTSEGLAQPELTPEYACGAVLDGKLFMMGSKNGLNHSKSVQMYDAAANSWSISPKTMNHEHMSCAATVFKGKLYVCGGESFYMVASSNCEVLDAVTGEWSLIPQMIDVRTAFALIGVNDKLIALGGNGHRTIESYDFKSKQWTKWELLMPQRHFYGIGAVVVEN